MHELPNDLLLAGGEQVIVGSSSWAEFRNYCDAHRDISLRFSGSTQGDDVADILVVEIQHSGKVRGVELLLYPRHPSPCTNADFTRCIPPGSYPLSPDLSSSLPVIPRIFPQLSGIRAPNELNRAHDGEARRTLLAFAAIIPTTLRDLVVRAGEMCLLDGITALRDGPHCFNETIINP